MNRIRDRSAVDGKILSPEEHAQVLIVGAGPAGLSAALESAAWGAKVLLIDENPIDPDLFGLDIPLYFGGRMTGSVRDRNRILERWFAAEPKFVRALELGVDIRLGVIAWGLYANGPHMQALPVPMVGLADEDRSWMCGFDKLILATGARDIALAFPGWDQPGVLGANGFRSLVERYSAFSGRRIVVFGSGPLAVSTALLARRNGIDVAAIVEVLDEAQSPAGSLHELIGLDIPVLTRHTPLRAGQGADGVDRLLLRDRTGKEVELSCDTICLAIGTAPAIDLLNSAGGRTVADARRGGHVPFLDGWATSIDHVFATGDCAGLAANEDEAIEWGRQASRQTLDKDWRGTPSGGADAWRYQVAWYEALTRQAEPPLIVCQCEAVTRADLLEVSAPRYLGRPTTRAMARNLSTLINDGPVSQDQIKRLTRAGMGVCQGRRCREQVALTLSQAAHITPAEVPLAGFRPPVRPLPLRVIADWAEKPAMAAHWELWFGIRGQWAAYEDIGTEREFESFFGGG
jgi:thioredoxin reductase